ncbi:Zinc-type alcohol dehydrogenase-like protein, partial [Colletotrichum shisoi]
MTLSVPRCSKQWNVTGQEGLESLKFSEQELPELGDSQVLVKFCLSSRSEIRLTPFIKFRDVTIPRGEYPWDVKPNVVPGSDGAGTVLAVGKHVTRFKPGDKVITILSQVYLRGLVTDQIAKSGLGGGIDGTFRTVGAFNEQGLVAMPTALTFVEAASLSCAGVTAWNALFRLSGKKVSAGQWVLTQGTGGVSIFAVQFAKAVGARVIVSQEYP